MAVNPAYAATPRFSGVAVPATADTSLTAPTNHATLFTPGSNGSKVEEIDLLGLGTTVAGRVNLFVVTSGTYVLEDQWMITAVTPSATQQVFKLTVVYSNLFVPNGSTLQVTVMEAGNQSLVECNAFGGDF